MGAPTEEGIEMLDGTVVTEREFKKVLSQQSVNLTAEAEKMVKDAFAFEVIQASIRERLAGTKDKNKRKMCKTLQTELGGLARSFAAFVCSELRNGKTEREAIQNAFDRWRKTRSFVAIAKRFH